MSITAPIEAIVAQVRDDALHSKRSEKQAQGLIGPSDVGGCRKRVMFNRDAAERGEPGYWLGAAMGSSWHVNLEDVANRINPGAWLAERAVTIRLGGLEFTGTADLICPDFNLVIDHKTTGDVSWVARYGVSNQHLLQAVCYAVGAAQEGLIELDKAHVQIVTWDRSATMQEPVVHTAPVSDELITEAADWIAGLQAATSADDFEYEAPPSFCYNLCEFVDVCRGSEPPAEVSEDIADAVDAINDANAQIKELNALKKAAQAKLDHFAGGWVGDTKVSWVHVPEKEIQSYTRAAYSRLQLTKRKKKA